MVIWMTSKITWTSKTLRHAHKGPQPNRASPVEPTAEIAKLARTDAHLRMTVAIVAMPMPHRIRDVRGNVLNRDVTDNLRLIANAISDNPTNGKDNHANKPLNRVRHAQISNLRTTPLPHRP